MVVAPPDLEQDLECPGLPVVVENDLSVFADLSQKTALGYSTDQSHVAMGLVFQGAIR